MSILTVANQKIGNDQEQKEPEKVRILCTAEKAPATKQPDGRSDDVNNSAERGAQEINNRNAQEQPNAHEIVERALDLICLADERDRSRHRNDIKNCDDFTPGA